MERLEAKRINGKTYYYYSEWGWVDGKCRRVWQKYLGRLEDIVAAVTGANDPTSAEVFEFGLAAALWREAERQDVTAILDKACPERRQGLSTGQYFTLAAVNRGVDPVSKRGMWEWFEATALRRLLPTASRAALDSRRFWDRMGDMPEAMMRKAWAELVGGAVAREGVDLSKVCYDGTNFYTFINTFNTAPALAKRGKNKQGRGNLRQVNYALFCAGSIPLYYEVYEGNLNDVSKFPAALAHFKQFLSGLGSAGASAAPRVTLVFDKGNNSKDNFAKLDASGLDYVASLKAGEAGEVADVPAADPRFAACEGLEGVKAFQIRLQLYGKERNVVVCHNQRFFETQMKTLALDIERAVAELGEIRQNLKDRADGNIKGGRAPTAESVRKRCDEALKRQYLSDIIKVEITPGPPLALDFSVISGQLDHVASQRLGRKVLMTTHDDWDCRKTIEAYHGQYVIEHIFRGMKGEHGTWWPLYHWTDQKIHAHGLYCSIAVLLRALAHRRAAQAGVKIPFERFLDELLAIKEVVAVFPGRKKRESERQHTVLTRLNEIQGKLVKALELETCLRVNANKK